LLAAGVARARKFRAMQPNGGGLPGRLGSTCNRRAQQRRRVRRQAFPSGAAFDQADHRRARPIKPCGLSVPFELFLCSFPLLSNYTHDLSGAPPPHAGYRSGARAVSVDDGNSGGISMPETHDAYRPAPWSQIRAAERPLIAPQTPLGCRLVRNCLQTPPASCGWEQRTSARHHVCWQVVWRP
jgi:hypothetical protein